MLTVRSSLSVRHPAGNVPGVRQGDLHAGRPTAAQFFTNVLDGQAPNLLLPNPATGRSLQLDFRTQTYDGEIGHAVVLGNRHRLSYGGNVRQNNFDIPLAPLGEDRLEVGGYLQDEIFWDWFRLVLGARVDKFGNLSDPKVSPRLAFLVKPAENHSVTLSFNQAYRAPSFRGGPHPLDSSAAKLRWIPGSCF